MPSLTLVPGLRVGHATDAEAHTGCTVVLGPFRASCDVRGLATGTRELDALSPRHLVPTVDAILLTGGSAFGLNAAAGVMAWLEERGAGFDTGFARVPIVPAAVIYDLGEGLAARRPNAAMGRVACEAASEGEVPEGSVGAGRADVRPDATMGRVACAAASSAPVPEGRVGAGTGATVGKIRGHAGAMRGGLGSWGLETAGFRVGALAVVNAMGDVLAADGRILAGARGEDGAFLDTARVLREMGLGGAFGRPAPAGNTTLGVVATDAPLTRTALESLARMAGTALARRISPVSTPFDGDVVFALSTSETAAELPPPTLLSLGAAASYALELAIERAVTS